jgi:hypothetical protein
MTLEQLEPHQRDTLLEELRRVHADAIGSYHRNRRVLIDALERFSDWAEWASGGET